MDLPDTVGTPYEIESPPGFPPITIPADNPTTVEGIALGKMLFFDPILSGNNTQACVSCHRQEFGFTDSANALSTGIDMKKGTRNSMPLSNLAWERRFFWDGGAEGLESQALGPILNPVEMHEDLNNAVNELKNHPKYPELFKKAFGDEPITSAKIAKALAQFERTMISFNSKFDKFQRNESGVTLSPQELNGRKLFQDPDKGDCTHCHSLRNLMTDSDFRNTGLDSIFADNGRYLITMKEEDIGKMKTPSLRNITVTAPYMHDGRFKTLDEVLEFYNTGFHYHKNLDVNLRLTKKGRLSEQDKKDIIAFISTFTDEEFLKNPKFRK